MNKFTEAEIISNQLITKDVYLVSVQPSFPLRAFPGQFCIIRVNQRLDPFLGRPFSIFDLNEKVIKFLYRVKGKGTVTLSKMKKGETVSITGPLGRWYPYPEGEFVIIAGGIGLASVYYLMRKFPKKAYLFYGIRSEKEILFYKELKKLAKKVYISTENGTAGYRGVVTDLFKEKGLSLNLPVYACGPMIMLEELKKIIEETNLSCYVAVEERMGCGIGACLGCVIKTNEGFKRVCTDGPIFELREIQL